MGKRVRLLVVVAGAAISAACSMLSGLDQLSAGSDADDIQADGSATQRPPRDGASTLDGASSGALDDGSSGPNEAGSSSGSSSGSGATLVGDWPFTEGTGTQINDVSGRGHHGTATGGQWTTDRTGAAGSAFALVGDTNHIAVAAHPDFDRPAGSKLTIVAWARADQAPDHAYLVDVGFGSEGYGLELRTSTTLTYWDGVAHSVNATIPDVVGAWHHYGVVVDGAQVRLYFDGVRVKDGTADTTPRVATEVVFGLDAVEPVYLRGALDKVRFYRGALTDAEIVAEMNR